MEVVIPHSLGKIEAKSRIEAGLPKLAAHIPGGGSLSSEWVSDYALHLVIGAMGQKQGHRIRLIQTGEIPEITVLTERPLGIGMVGDQG